MDFKGLSDNEVMEILKTADSNLFQDGFKEIVMRYKNNVATFIYRSMGDRVKSEDLAQETFVRVFKHIKNYRSSAKFSTWIFTIARNLVKDEFKYKSRHPVSEMDEGANEDISVQTSGPAKVSENFELKDKIQITLKSMPSEDREILVLREIEGLKYEEIAEILSLPVGTVKSRISRVRDTFVEIWKRKGVNIA